MDRDICSSKTTTDKKNNVFKNSWDFYALTKEAPTDNVLISERVDDEVVMTDELSLRLSDLIHLKNQIEFVVDKVYPSYEILVSSGYRTPKVNKRVGGVSTSDHLKGLAIDVTFYDEIDGSVVSGKELQELAITIDELLGYKIRQMIVYPTFYLLALDAEYTFGSFFHLFQP